MLKTRVGTTPGNQLVKACIGRETHQDGNYHLHICAWYSNGLRFSSADYLDLEGHHPNVRGSRVQNKIKALTYCSKEDPEPLQFNMDIKAETLAREGHKKIIGKRLLDGEPLVEVMEEHPELLFGYKRLKADLGAYFKDRARHQKY